MVKVVGLEWCCQFQVKYVVSSTINVIEVAVRHCDITYILKVGISLGKSFFFFSLGTRWHQKCKWIQLAVSVVFRICRYCIFALDSHVLCIWFPCDEHVIPMCCACENEFEACHVPYLLFTDTAVLCGGSKLIVFLFYSRIFFSLLQYFTYD